MRRRRTAYAPIFLALLFSVGACGEPEGVEEQRNWHQNNRSWPGEPEYHVFATPGDSETSTRDTAVEVGIFVIDHGGATLPPEMFEDLRGDVSLMKWPSREPVEVSWEEGEQTAETVVSRFVTLPAEQLSEEQVYAVKLTSAPRGIERIGGGFVPDPEGGWVARFSRSPNAILHHVSYCLGEDSRSDYLSVAFSEEVDLESDFDGAFRVTDDADERLECIPDTDYASELPRAPSVELECSRPIEAGQTYNFTYAGGLTAYFVDQDIAPTFGEAAPFTVEFTAINESAGCASFRLF